MDNERDCLNRAVRIILREVRAAAQKASGRSAKKKPDSDTLPAAAETQTALSKPVKDGQEFIKREVLKELSAITKGMIQKAKSGGTGPLKLLWELGKLHEDATNKRKTRAPSLGKLLMDEVRRKEAEKKSEG